ncbi:hypothetical protein [Desulforamulus hydrothermalis]|uniref:hypothetical protein n=1 Tax=Desulforamulus hydrothermalis TaxID=412895 RepID=UPI0013918CB8|nr:hypothetical protein [Desulforamulus hydrothermalis]
MIPFGSGLRADSTMISFGHPWGSPQPVHPGPVRVAPTSCERHPNVSFCSSSAVTGASTSRRQGIIKPPHFILQPLSTV